MRIYTRAHGEAMDLDEPVATLAADASVRPSSMPSRREAISAALPGALAHGPGALSECGNRFSGRQQDGSGHGIRSCVAHAVSRTSGAGFLYSRKPPNRTALISRLRS